MKYLLSLTHKEPLNNMVFECENKEELDRYSGLAREQGYTVKVKEVTDRGKTSR